MAIIIVERANEVLDQTRNYDIIVDNFQIGSISSGQKVTFQIPGGRHSIHLKIDWCSSNTITFDISDLNQKKFVCRSNLVGWRRLLPFIVVIFQRDRYLFLEMLDDDLARL